MASARLDGIDTRYEIIGSGPPLLMFSPGGFDATLEKWQTLGIYAQSRMFESLSAHYRCIVFDRRECGQSGGRVEVVSWAHYAAQAKALLDHLQIERAHLMGGCMGCCPVLAFAVAHPEAVSSMLLYWPVGGARYRINGRKRFADHLAYARQHGLAAVAALVRQEGKAFNADPRGGPWASVIRNDLAFANAFAVQDLGTYERIVSGMARSLLDRDTAPGAEPEDLLALEIPALVVPGRDASHATSAARYLEECLPRADYWDAAPAEQTEHSVAPRLLQFLAGAAP
jgi:pimeloyl-ACP methyl ester carboxylesterase